MLTQKDVEQLSQSLNEPEWLLEERLYAFSIFEELITKDTSKVEKFDKIYSKSNNKLIKKIPHPEHSAGFGIMSFHDLLYNELRAEFAKEAFLNKEHKPEKSIDIAFALAFFTHCNFYFAEASQKCDLKNEIEGGVSIDLFFFEDSCTGNLLRKIKDGIKLEEYTFSSNCNIESLIINDSHHDSFLSCSNIIGERSTLNTYSAFFGPGKMEILNKLVGEDAQAYDVELFVEGDSNSLSLNSILQHSGRSTKGNVFVKGIAKDSANVKLDGMIKIDKNGAGAESFLDQHIMLMNPGCRAEANPELEIENNDVSSRHSASVSQIDEEKLFYAAARGMNPEEAKEMMIDGFLNSAVERIKSDKLKEEVVAMMEKYR